MNEEYFLALALPHSTAEDADHHVSVFISPKLTAQNTNSVLGTFDLFPDWAKRAGAASITLEDQNGPIECTPLVDVIEPEVWNSLFPPSTPVRTNTVPDWSGRQWRSFSAKTVHDIGKLVHLQSMYASPTSPPAPAQHPLAKAVTGFTSDMYTSMDLPRGYEQRIRYDESRLTTILDDTVEHGTLAEVEKKVAGTRDFLERIFLELHRARRYYERPESENEYHERGEKASENLPPQTPEFHERVATAGDHPQLLRILGLVIDLRVHEVSRLRKSRWLSVGVQVDPQVEYGRRTRVAVRALAGGSLVTVPETTDWVDGALTLGDEDTFSVLDLEADGAALKTERFLWTLPRLLASEENDDPVTAATPAMRASGFTITRTSEALATQKQITRQKGLEPTLTSSMSAANAPLLSTEDVNRGFRVEVWDDSVKRWFSLHSRLSDVIVDGHGMVLEDLPEEGFIQGTPAHETPGVAASPVHVHEAMFGWEGWSLAAPRPGKRVRNELTKNADGSPRMIEVVEETPIDAMPGEQTTHPIRFRNEVTPGTLPRLRFGRYYAFRAWAVDLAGNTRAHELNPQPLPPKAVDNALAGRGFSTTRAAWRRHMTVGGDSAIVTGLQATLRDQVETRRSDAAHTVTGSMPDVSHFVTPDVLGTLLGRMRERRGSSIAPIGMAVAGSRRSLVGAAFDEAVLNDEQPFARSTALRDAETLGRVIASQAAAHGGMPVGVVRPGPAVTAAAKTVTTLRPYLRWDPIPSPAIVPRKRYTEGESLRVIVIRSGVTQDPDTLEVSIIEPENYALEAEMLIPGVGYRSTSDRHLAPPHTSQVQSEQHGMFDKAFGSTAPVNHRAMLAWAVRENGSFFDLEVAHPTDPNQMVPQDNVRLEQAQGEPRTTPATLPLPAGEAPQPGQYVVHDVDDLVLPYLPDPLANGIALVFSEAGAGRTIPFPFGTEGFTVAYQGKWPFIEPFRFTLEGSAELDAHVSGRRVRLALPPGDRQRFRLSSSLNKAGLAKLGVWQTMPPMVTANPDVAEAAADGMLWGLTPAEDVLLVHAVPRPVEAPRPTRIFPLRGLGMNSCVLFGAVDVHGPSTDSITAEAEWSEPVDDLTLPKWEERASNGVAFTTPVLEFEDLAVLAGKEADAALPGVGRLRLHASTHAFADTKHKMVSYRFRATTRFREYFAPELLAGSPGTLDDGKSLVSAPVTVSIPSSGIPAAPVIHSVLPLFRWSDGEEPEQPAARRHSRRAGVRIYLERPWYSTGEGELLGVLLAIGGNDDSDNAAEDESGYPFVSKWGGDPVWVSAPVAKRALTTVQLDNLLREIELDDRVLPGRPVAGPVTLPLPKGNRGVTVLGYKPQYNEDRGLWYVDVVVDPTTAFWPFVRFAVARYQPDSVAGAHLSPAVLADFVQLPPERVTSVSRTDDHHVRVVVSGPVGIRHASRLSTANLPHTPQEMIAHNRIVVASLQKVDPEIGGDLGWQTKATVELVVRGIGANISEAAWVGELASKDAIALARPGRSSTWRVRIEEWERFPGDPPAPADQNALGEQPVWEQRLVFADDVAL